MGDYLPLYKPGESITGTASAAITGGKLVYVSGDGTIANAAAAANIPVGVAAFDVATAGDKVTYFARGTVHRLVAAGAITAGAVVEAGASGNVAAHTVGTNDARVFGIALTTAADGAAVEIMEL